MTARWYAKPLPYSPRAFLLINVVLLAVGVALWFCDPATLRDVSGRIRPDRWGRFLSIYVCSIALGTVVVFAIMEFLARLLHLHDDAAIAKLSIDERRANFWSPVITGYAELILYPIAIVWAHPEFIGAWLVIKVAGQWVGWQGAAADEKKPHTSPLSLSRWRYNRFIVGNALNIIVAVGTYAVMKAAGVFV